MSSIGDEDDVPDSIPIAGMASNANLDQKQRRKTSDFEYFDPIKLREGLKNEIGDIHEEDDEEEE